MNMNFDVGKFNNLLTLANDRILCGPECQKEREIEALRKKFYSAQQNMDTAPEQLSQAKKNYYMVADGAAEYNNIQLKELQQEVNKKAASLQTTFYNRAENINTLINNYASSILYSQNMNDLLETYNKENKKLLVKIDDMKGVVNTSDRKSFYEDNQLTYLRSWLYYLKRFYWLCFAIWFVLVMLIKRQYKVIVAWMMAAAFVIYPFVADYITYYLIRIIKYTISFIPTNVYRDIADDKK